MGPAMMASFFALLLIGGVVCLAVAIVRPSTRAAVAETALVLGALVAVGATAGSLYFSEIADFVPCELCWYQRIAMYPLAIVLPLAAWGRDRAVLRYGLVLTGIGLAISTYHVQLQLFPDQGSVCALDNPCSGRWIEALGWMTIPQMAGLSFALVAVLLALASFRPAYPDSSADGGPSTPSAVSSSSVASS